MHNLFLVHGMGIHETDSWADDVKSKLKEVASRYAYFEYNEIEDLINFFPISYDEKLGELLELWKENASEMSSFLEEKEIETEYVSKILDVFENASEKEKNFFWSHIADVLIYRLFATYQASIRTHVAQQFVEGINRIKEHNPDHQASTVITHSLGNIVTHDALHMLGKNMFSHSPVFSPNDWKFQNLFSLANVCRIMQTDFNPYESIIRPVSSGEEAYYRYFIHVSHPLDPFIIPLPFKPTGWGNGYVPLKVNHYHDWNIHGFDHYLDHPRVHIPLLKNIISLNCITNEEEQAAYNSYDGEKQFGGNLKCIGDIKTIVENELKPLIESIDEQTTLMNILPTILKGYAIYEKIKETSEACNENQ